MMQRKERVGFFKSLQGVCSLLRSETEKFFFFFFYLLVYLFFWGGGRNVTYLLSTSCMPNPTWVGC